MTRNKAKWGGSRLLSSSVLHCWCPLGGWTTWKPQSKEAQKMDSREVSLPGHREEWSRKENESEGKQNNHHTLYCPLLCWAFNKLCSLLTAHQASHKTFSHTQFPKPHQTMPLPVPGSIFSLKYPPIWMPIYYTSFSCPFNQISTLISPTFWHCFPFQLCYLFSVVALQFTNNS